MKIECKALLGLLAFAFAPLASADPSLILTDGTAANTVTLSSPTGSIISSGAVGGWTFNVTSALASPPNPALAGPFPHMDVSSLDVYSGSGSSTLYILFTDDGLTLPAPGFDMTIGGAVNGVGNTLTYSAYYDTGNVLFGRTTPVPGTAPGGASATAHLINVLGPFGTGPCCTPGHAVGPGPGVSPPKYSLTEMVVLTAKNGVVSNASFDAELQVTPEPSTIILLGSSLLFLGKLFRKSRRTTTSA
jgi:hypothetical protein